MSPSSSNPATNVNTFAYLATGSFGGGYGFIDGGLSLGIFTNSGSLCFGYGGAGTPVTTRYSFDGGGTATAVNWIATSDRSLKKNIRKAKANGSLADLLELCTWMWKDGSGAGKGVIAQRVMEIAPEYVHRGHDGLLGIDKAGLALECVIGLADRVRALEGK